MLRARYFLDNGYAEYADKDLEQLPEEDASRPEVVALRARVYTALNRLPDADAVLAKAVSQYPQNADLIARLAENKLNMGNKPEAQSQVEQALHVQPDCVRALYVRGRLQEVQGELKKAQEDYLTALSDNPRFAPALSRMWRLQQQSGANQEAITSLEALVSQNEATLEEKVALADLYARTHSKLEQGLKLIAEALRQDASNFQYLDIQKELKKGLPKKKGPSGPIIMKGGRHR